MEIEACSLIRPSATWSLDRPGGVGGANIGSIHGCLHDSAYLHRRHDTALKGQNWIDFEPTTWAGKGCHVRRAGKEDSMIYDTILLSRASHASYSEEMLEDRSNSDELGTFLEEAILTKGEAAFSSVWSILSSMLNETGHYNAVKHVRYIKGCAEKSYRKRLRVYPK